MTFRTRLQLAFVALAVVSVGGLALAVRLEMTRRLTGEYQRRVTSQVDLIRNDLTGESEEIAGRLAGVARALAGDNRFRLAVISGADRGYLLDYAAQAMRLAGLTMLQVQDAEGRIVSSGHFRNEFDRPEPDLPRLVAQARGPALVEARAPEGPFLALVRADSAHVGHNRLWLVGGRAVGPEFVSRLAGGGDLVVTLASAAGTLSSAGPAGRVTGYAVAEEIDLPFVVTEAGGARVATARLVVSQPVTPLAQLRRSVDRWSLIAGLVAIAAALLLGAWASARLSRPLAELAQQTSLLDLERLDVDFAGRRADEVGALARVLTAMTDRLRRGARQLRDAERRAAVGDVARQVNHDIKNGLAPIRNALRHLAEVADREPEQLPTIFQERKGTLDSGVQYLETLAANYARLTPRLDGGSADVRAVVEDVVRGVTGAVTLKAEIAAGVSPVRADSVVLRRILENLVSNAVDAAGLGARPSNAAVLITAEGAEVNRETAEGSMGVRITVTDTGPGMTNEQLEQAFEDFYTTKPGGTGLGLSVVRRLVADLQGTLRVQTEPGTGTTVAVLLPAAGPPDRPTA